MRANVHSAGCLVPLDRIRSAAFRILTVYLASDAVHELQRYDSHAEYATRLTSLYDGAFRDEITELLLFVAVALRVHNDAQSRTLLADATATLGYLIVSGGEPSPLMLKDALDKVIHAMHVEFKPGRLEEPRGQVQLPGNVPKSDCIRDFVVFHGEQGGEAWRCRLDLLPFCAEICRIIDEQPRPDGRR